MNIKKIFNKKNILVTGGTGSFGSLFINSIINNFKPNKLIIFSRDELKQSIMSKKYPQKKYPFIRFFIGDVRDYERLKMAMKDVHLVIHAAALKQVDTAEYNPFEFIKTNIIGAENIINVALRNKISKVIALSTDKAVDPVNLYGSTKLASDKLFIAANNLVGKDKISFSLFFILSYSVLLIAPIFLVHGFFQF